MNRIDLIALLLTAFIGTLLFLQNAQAGRDGLINEVSAMHLDIRHDSSQIIEASYRLVNHSKMIVIESLTIAKKSVNLALDSAIETL